MNQDLFYLVFSISGVIIALLISIVGYYFVKDSNMKEKEINSALTSINLLFSDDGPLKRLSDHVGKKIDKLDTTLNNLNTSVEKWGLKHEYLEKEVDELKGRVNSAEKKIGVIEKLRK